MADHRRRDEDGRTGGLNNGPARSGAHAPRPARPAEGGPQRPARRQAAGSHARPAAPGGANGLCYGDPAPARPARTTSPAQSDSAARPRPARKAPRRAAGGDAAVPRPAAAPDSARRSGSRRPNPSRPAPHPASAAAGAQAYRRSDDGSGYRPAAGPAGAGGKKGGKNSKGKGPWRVVFAVALVILVLSLGVLGFLAFSYWQGQNAYDKIADEAFAAPEDIEGASLEDLQVDWDALRAINPDVVGWIYIPGTVVNYPIVHTDNDERYLTYDFNGQQGFGATFGTIFLSAANAADFSDANNIVYGHHLNNGSMFACLADFQDAAQFNAHRTVYLLTPQGNYRLTTFSLVHCAADDPLAQTAFGSAEDMAAYVQDKMGRSVAAPEGSLPDASAIDHIFAFVTCDNLPSDGRYVLFAYVDETTVPGQHAAGGAQEAGGPDTENDAASAVSDATEELAAA